MKKRLWVFLMMLAFSNLFADESPDFYRQALNFYLGNHYRNAGECLQIDYQGNPDDWRAHQLMGYCDYLLKNETESLFECRKSLELNRENPRLVAFVDWLKTPAPRAVRKSDEDAYLEGRQEAQMPPPPDEDPDRKPDSYLTGSSTPLPTPIATSIPTPKPNETVFVKAGIGTYLYQLLFTDYNRPDVNGIPSEIDTTYDEITGLTGSAAGGIEDPDHFSYFVSGEWLTYDWSIMVNAQYTFAKLKIIKPYLYGGLGLDFKKNSSIGPGGQAGLGILLPLRADFDVFLEGKLFGALGDRTSSGNPTSSYSWADGYISVLTGLKWTLPGNHQEEELSTGANAPGHPFLELAGGIDSPWSNWQSAYRPSAGEKFAAGFEFQGGLVFQLDLENSSFSGTNYAGAVTDNELLILPTVRYFLNESVIRPYLLAGLGAEFESSTSLFVDSSVVNLDAVAGAGIEVPLGRQISVFTEGKYNFVFADGILGQDIPVFGGMRIGL